MESPTGRFAARNVSPGRRDMKASIRETGLTAHARRANQQPWSAPGFCCKLESPRIAIIQTRSNRSPDCGDRCASQRLIDRPDGVGMSPWPHPNHPLRRHSQGDCRRWIEGSFGIDHDQRPRGGLRVQQRGCSDQGQRRGATALGFSDPFGEGIEPQTTVRQQLVQSGAAGGEDSGPVDGGRADASDLRAKMAEDPFARRLRERGCAFRR